MIVALYGGIPRPPRLTYCSVIPDRHVFGIMVLTKVLICLLCQLLSRECIASRAPFRGPRALLFQGTHFASGFPMDWDGRRSRLRKCQGGGGIGRIVKVRARCRRPWHFQSPKSGGF